MYEQQMIPILYYGILYVILYFNTDLDIWCILDWHKKCKTNGYACSLSGNCLDYVESMELKLKPLQKLDLDL